MVLKQVQRKREYLALMKQYQSEYHEYCHTLRAIKEVIFCIQYAEGNYGFLINYHRLAVKLMASPNLRVSITQKYLDEG